MQESENCIARQNSYIQGKLPDKLSIDICWYGIELNMHLSHSSFLSYLLWFIRVIFYRYLPLHSPGNIYFLLNFFRDAGPKCPVDNERLNESQVSKFFLACFKLN